MWIYAENYLTKKKKRSDASPTSKRHQHQTGPSNCLLSGETDTRKTDTSKTSFSPAAAKNFRGARNPINSGGKPLDGLRWLLLTVNRNQFQPDNCPRATAQQLINAPPGVHDKTKTKRQHTTLPKRSQRKRKNEVGFPDDLDIFFLLKIILLEFSILSPLSGSRKWGMRCPILFLRAPLALAI